MTMIPLSYMERLVTAIETIATTMVEQRKESGSAEALMRSLLDVARKQGERLDRIEKLHLNRAQAGVQ